MALPDSGTLGFLELNIHVGRAETHPCSLNETIMRNLAGQPSGDIGISDFYGKWAGNKLTSALAGSIHGYMRGSQGDFTFAQFAGAEVRIFQWSSNSIMISTMPGQPKPSSRNLIIRDANLNPVGTYTLSAWGDFGGGEWLTTCAAPVNPIPAGTVRWITW